MMKDIMISVGETTMMSKHQIPFDRHLEERGRRNRQQQSRSTMQFKMPTFAPGFSGFDQTRQSAKIKIMDTGGSRNIVLPL